jgi:hypothetical protein
MIPLTIPVIAVLRHSEAVTIQPNIAVSIISSSYPHYTIIVLGEVTFLY